MSPRALLPLLFALAACRPSPHEGAGVPAAIPPTPPAVPARDAVRDVKASMHRFLATRRFHAQMQVEGAQPMTGEMDYVAPDRYRITLPGGTQTVIGNMLHMQVDGRHIRVPLPPETLAPWRDPLKLQQAQQALSAEHIGDDTVAGRPALPRSPRHFGSGRVRLLDRSGWPATATAPHRSGRQRPPLHSAVDVFAL